MAESTLSLGYTDFRKAVGYYLDWGRDSDDWDADQTAIIDEIVQTGYRNFLYPDPLPNETVAHEWSFLRQVTTISTAVNDEDQDLPDNFGGVEGNLTYPPTTSYPEIFVVGEGVIRAWRQGSTATDRPTHAAVRPKSSTGSTGQRFEIMWFPTPDSTYVISYVNVVLVNKLTVSAPYPLGGMAHAETVQQSCLAVAEARMNDDENVQLSRYQSRLRASVNHDRNVGRPRNYGASTDWSDHPSRFAMLNPAISTLNGASP